MPSCIPAAPIRLLGLSGSLRRDSYCTAVLRSLEYVAIANINSRVREGRLAAEATLDFVRTALGDLLEDIRLLAQAGA
ncbi:hypothetical protein VAR608DRAFT_0343 [Variovorax sp. HW608]|uniref:hypothetical protein n=1 Tax=Variovorax sp. HW608 TaxID=1034889 RepID=UPI00081FDAC1|nr:hypothetical protein [Variovorax sp. HW608]SCK09437.1 hypothetical protein VAR608DRAFT_0343 [Variovorax sp. HW608]